MCKDQILLSFKKEKKHLHSVIQMSDSVISKVVRLSCFIEFLDALASLESDISLTDNF